MRLPTRLLALSLLMACEPILPAPAEVAPLETSERRTPASEGSRDPVVSQVGGPAGIHSRRIPANPPEEETSRLAAHLRARHVRDLPTPTHLATYPDAPASLRWIATHDERMVVRARALGLLKHDASPATHALLLGVIDGDAHPSLRAAAIMGSAGLSLDARLQEALQRGVHDPDPRVNHAARDRMTPRTVSPSDTTAP